MALFVLSIHPVPYHAFGSQRIINEEPLIELPSLWRPHPEVLLGKMLEPCLNFKRRLKLKKLYSGVLYRL